jgi:hypothetical protein
LDFWSYEILHFLIVLRDFLRAIEDLLFVFQIAMTVGMSTTKITAQITTAPKVATGMNLKQGVRKVKETRTIDPAPEEIISVFLLALNASNRSTGVDKLWRKQRLALPLVLLRIISLFLSSQRRGSNHFISGI